MRTEHWRAFILYGNDQPWGEPEEIFEEILKGEGIHLRGVDAGTDMMTGERDYACYFNATQKQMEAIRSKASPLWRYESYDPAEGEN